MNQAKYLARLVVGGSRILGRAFTLALKEEYTASQQAAQARRSQPAASSDSQRTVDQIGGISLEEAKQILNVTDLSDKESIVKKYKHLFEVNAKENGGSLYIQSKIFRAKERIDEELEYERDKRNGNQPDERETPKN